MPTTLYRATVFALYQLSLLAGVLLLPVALLVRQVGVDLPLGRVVDRLNEAYHRTAAE